MIDTHMINALAQRMCVLLGQSPHRHVPTSQRQILLPWETFGLQEDSPVSAPLWQTMRWHAAQHLAASLAIREMDDTSPTGRGAPGPDNASA